MRTLILVIALAGALPAQPEPQIKRIFPLKYADVNHVAGVLSIFGYSIRADSNLHIIAVSAPKEGIVAIEEAIKHLDVPQAPEPDVDLTVHLIVASEKPGGETPPADLEPVLKQIRAIFPYRGFRVLDTALLRTKAGGAGQARTNGIVSAVPDGPKSAYGLVVRSVSVRADATGRSIALGNLGFTLKIPLPNSNPLEAVIDTEITVKEGQKTVVGKASLGGPDQALFLVITARVVQ